MARFAPIAPLHIYRQMQEEGILGSYHMLLAHEVADDLEGFQKIFNNLESKDAENQTGTSDRQLILDNGTVEMGEPMPVSQIADAVEAVDPTFVILPDYLKEYTQTIDAIELAVSDEGGWLAFSDRFMLCPQGATEDEILKCAHHVINIMGVPIKLLGVGRWTANAFGTRKRLINRLADAFPNIPIHVLGFSENIRDDIKCSHLRNVIGIDSARPILLGLEGIEFTQESPKDRPHRETSKAWAESDITDVMRFNLACARKWIEQ